MPRNKVALVIAIYIVLGLIVITAAKLGETTLRSSDGTVDAMDTLGEGLARAAYYWPRLN
jgi:hypothetical protein